MYCQQKIKFTSNFAVLYKNFVFNWILWIFFASVLCLRVGGCARNPVPYNKVMWKFLTSSERTPWRGIHTRDDSCCTSKTWNSSTHRRMWPTSNSVFLECGWLLAVMKWTYPTEFLSTLMLLTISNCRIHVRPVVTSYSTRGWQTLKRNLHADIWGKNDCLLTQKPNICTLRSTNTHFFSIYFVLQTYFHTNFLSFAARIRGSNPSGAREFFPGADPRSCLVNTGIKRSQRELHPSPPFKSEASHTWNYKTKRKLSLCGSLRHLCVARLIIILDIKWGELSVSSPGLFTCG
jgi:hypothetical protein